MPSNPTSLCAACISGFLLLLSQSCVTLNCKQTRSLLRSEDNETKGPGFVLSSILLIVASCLSHANLFMADVTVFPDLLKRVASTMANVDPFDPHPLVPAKEPDSSPKQIGYYIARFAQCLVENYNLVDFIRMLSIVCSATYLLHSAFTGYVGGKVVGFKEKEAKEVGSAATSKSSPPPPQSSVDVDVDLYVKGVCFLLSISSYLVPSIQPIQQAVMLGRTLMLLAFHLQHKNIAHSSNASSSAMLTYGGILHLLSVSSLITAMVVERVKYEPLALLNYARNLSWSGGEGEGEGEAVEIHALVVLLLRMALTALTLTSHLLETRRTKLLIFTFLLVIFVGPFGVGWIRSIYNIQPIKLMPWTYFAFTLAYVCSVFFNGAPGAIAMFALGNGLCAMHGIDVNQIFVAGG